MPPPLASFEWRSSGGDQPPPPLQNPYPWGSSGTATSPPPCEWRSSGGNRPRARASQSTRLAPLRLNRFAGRRAARSSPPDRDTTMTDPHHMPPIPRQMLPRTSSSTPAVMQPPVDTSTTACTNKPGNADIGHVTSGGIGRGAGVCRDRSAAGLPGPKGHFAPGQPAPHPRSAIDLATSGSPIMGSDVAMLDNSLKINGYAGQRH
jgi:hypothetical protein